MRFTLRLARRLLPLAMGLVVAAATPVVASPDHEVQGAHGAVACVSRVASQVGVDVLRAGGNAVDAAVAVALALAVVYPEAGNLGGGGFMLIRPASGSAVALDYRETAPAAAKRDMYLDAAGHPTADSLIGPRAVAVPGTVAGLEVAHRRYGRLPWARLVAPAVALARDGFVVNAYLASSIASASPTLSRFPETARILLPGGRVPHAGQRLYQPELARTLVRVAHDGARGFYAGPVARAIAADQAATHGLITEADLAAYRPAWRKPLAFGYRGYTVLSMPPSSSGGTVLAEALHILEGFDLHAAGWHSQRHLHLLAEAERRAFADRNAYLGDPAFVPDQPVDELSSARYAVSRRRTIQLDRATPEAAVPGLGAPDVRRHESEETTHFSVVDRWGGAVSNTYTLNNNFGSGVVAKGTGVLLNDEMDDFAAAPGAPNLFGLVQGERNAIAPGKRPLSSMAPSLVLDPAGRLFLAIGSPGGSTIPSTVLQVISNVIDFGMPLDAAIAAPRVHQQDRPDRIDTEPGGLPPGIVRDLEAMGHPVHVRTPIGDAQGVLRRPDGSVAAFADPRRGGQAAAY